MKILIADEMEKEVIEKIAKIGTVSYKPSNLVEEMSNSEVLIVRSATKVDEKLLANTSKLKLIIRAGVGLDNVDIEAANKKNIEVLNTPNASTNAVAEFTIGLIFSLFRKIHLAHLSMKNGKWEKKLFIGNEISGKTLGILGFGRIGSEVAKKAMALGMKVIAYSSSKKEMEGVTFFDDFEKFISSLDVLSIHLSTNKETIKMINKKTLSIFKKGSCIINTSRGEIIDEEALFESLKAGQIAAAALDVFTKEPYSGKFSELENVLLTPHIGASTTEAQTKIGHEIIRILKEKF